MEWEFKILTSLYIEGLTYDINKALKNRWEIVNFTVYNTNTNLYKLCFLKRRKYDRLVNGTIKELKRIDNEKK